MPRLVVALFGPPGAGKTTIARQSGLTIYDRDDPLWKTYGEAHFRRGIMQLATDPHAQAVVIRSGTTSTARARTIRDIGATHAYLILTDPATCHYRVGHRRREDRRVGQAAIDTWYAKFDHHDRLPHWPGDWEQVYATAAMKLTPAPPPARGKGLPAHRRGTTGRPWRRFRDRVLDHATHCANCNKPFVTDAPCAHPSHGRMPGCPTHPRYPTLEHRHALIDGGAVRDVATAAAWCYECNSRGGAMITNRGKASALQW